MQQNHANDFAFVAVKGDSFVVTHSNDCACVAVKGDGCVVIRGDLDSGGNSEAVRKQLAGGV